MSEETLVLTLPNWLAGATIVRVGDPIPDPPPATLPITITPSDEDPALPVENLVDQDLSTVWSSGGPTTTFFGIDLGAPLEVAGAYLPAHDGTSNSQWRLQGNDSLIPLTGAVGTATDSGYHPLLVDPLYPHLPTSALRRQQAGLHLLDSDGKLAPAVHRYWRVELQEVTEAGGLKLGPALALDLLEGYSITEVSRTIRRRLEGSDVQVYLRRGFARATLPVVADAAAGPRTILRLLRGHEVGVSIFPAAAEAPAMSFWGEIVGEQNTMTHQTGQTYTDQRFSHYKATLVIEER